MSSYTCLPFFNECFAIHHNYTCTSLSLSLSLAGQDVFGLSLIAFSRSYFAYVTSQAAETLCLILIDARIRVFEFAGTEQLPRCRQNQSLSLSMMACILQMKQKVKMCS
ncbi:hypothetical protein O6H91_01G168400 [Diphasiastrum complanatum]|uniref:Uncharacterized protein n=1 Tax=Diphasiastrum complanatum TaxID=34168 RepID=A0ACC2EYL3_DIPCM|nr:hypothetical protein O6H91_01G168400 [Diphasiastrum complanatum]